MYRFTANSAMVKMFKLKKAVFTGETIKDAIVNAISERDYEMFIPKQSPLVGGKKIGSVHACINTRFIVIGLIEKV